MLEAVLLVTEHAAEGFAWKGLVPCDSSLQVDSRSCVDGVECLKGRLPADVDWVRVCALSHRRELQAWKADRCCSSRN